MYDLVDSIMPMFMDVYKPFDSQDPDTGSIKKEWQFDRTVPCSAKGIISNSLTYLQCKKRTYKLPKLFNRKSKRVKDGL